LFSGFDSSKKREKGRREPAVGIGPGTTQTQPQGGTVGAFSTGQDPRDMGGVTIQEFSRSRKIAEPEAWRMLRRGELVGRTFEGRLYVFTNAQEPLAESAGDEITARINDLIEEDTGSSEDTAAGSDELLSAEVAGEPEQLQAATESAGESALPPLPGNDAGSRAGAAAESAVPPGMMPVPTERITNTELALLLDHLSLAKEENREILKMTQESIRKVTELTDTIVEMKDSVIDAKEAQIMFLKDQLESREKEIRKLLQQKEDLEILAQTIMTHQPK
jgi:hypothetical protein